MRWKSGRRGSPSASLPSGSATGVAVLAADGDVGRDRVQSTVAVATVAWNAQPLRCSGRRLRSCSVSWIPTRRRSPRRPLRRWFRRCRRRLTSPISWRQPIRPGDAGAVVPRSPVRPRPSARVRRAGSRWRRWPAGAGARARLLPPGAESPPAASAPPGRSVWCW